ncbi:hypothetical protein N9P66_01210 [Salibacteraceae bacterium]|nr:hypothetical protein [Salibacteraceae bacterium]
MNNIIKSKNSKELQYFIQNSNEVSEAFEENLSDIKINLKQRGLKSNKDMIVNYICSNYLSYNIKYVIEEDIKLYKNIHNLKEINSFRNNINREKKSLYISMCLQNIIEQCKIIQTIWDRETIDEVPDIDKLILDTGKSVSWMGDKIGLMRFYNNGSTKTWRYRFIQQLGLQLENQMKQINGII